MHHKPLVNNTDDFKYALILLSEPVCVMLVTRQKFAVFKHWDVWRVGKDLAWLDTK